jgi:heme exporter protein D
MRTGRAGAAVPAAALHYTGPFAASDLVRMRNLDFSSWQALLSTLLGIAVITLIGVGIRLLAMQTIQQRRERENRQINERLRTLIAAYKTLGGSFTGNLAVDPTHLRDLRRRAAGAEADAGGDDAIPAAGSDRARRMRDAVEAALSDIILLGTEDQVRLAARAAAELAEGRPIHTHELVVSLRDFVRHALDLDPIPGDVRIPKQGPTRPGSGAGGGRGKGEGEAKGGGRGAGGSGLGAGMGLGAGIGLGSAGLHDDGADGERDKGAS